MCSKLMKICYLAKNKKQKKKSVTLTLSLSGFSVPVMVSLRDLEEAMYWKSNQNILPYFKAWNSPELVSIQRPSL